MHEVQYEYNSHSRDIDVDQSRYNIYKYNTAATVSTSPFNREYLSVGLPCMRCVSSIESVVTVRQAGESTRASDGPFQAREVQYACHAWLDRRVCRGIYGIPCRSATVLKVGFGRYLRE